MFHFSELAKINTFYSEKLAEATRKFATLKSELLNLTEHQPSEKKLFGFGRKKDTALYKDKVPPRKLQDLKLAFSEYYLSLILIQNYQNLNFTGMKARRLKRFPEFQCIYFLS